MQPITTELVLNALRLWHSPVLPDHPFHQTYLAAHPSNGASPQERYQNTLMWAMNRLKEMNPKHHALLEIRFIHGKEISYVCELEAVAEATILYRQRQAVKQLTAIIAEINDQAQQDWQDLTAGIMPSPTYTKLIGIDDKIQTTLTAVETNTVVAIDGIGGIGKTALTDYTVRQILALGTSLNRVGWVTAKQSPQHLSYNHIESRTPAVTPIMLVNELCNQWEIKSNSRLAAQREVERLLDEEACLIVIDNLETHADYQILLPVLQKRRAHTRFVLTTRRRLLHDHVCSINMTELSPTDSFALIRHEAGQIGYSELATADDEILTSIHQAVGGNPLAIKLMVNQLRFHSMDRVLTGMKTRPSVNGRNVFDHIYELTWRMVNDLQKTALITLSQAGAIGFTFEHIAEVSGISEGQLYEVLESLIELSLVDSDGDIYDRRYRLHQLTATFINNILG